MSNPERFSPRLPRRFGEALDPSRMRAYSKSVASILLIGSLRGLPCHSPNYFLEKFIAPGISEFTTAETPARVFHMWSSGRGGSVSSPFKKYPVAANQISQVTQSEDWGPMPHELWL